jgi:hypothetical protein
MTDAQQQTQIRTEIEAFKKSCLSMLRSGQSMQKRVALPDKSENYFPVLNEHKKQVLIFIFV